MGRGAREDRDGAGRRAAARHPVVDPGADLGDEDGRQRRAAPARAMDDGRRVAARRRGGPRGGAELGDDADEDGRRRRATAAGHTGDGRRRRRQRSTGSVGGGAAERWRFIVPDGCDLVAAGALPVAFGTAHLALVHRAQLKAGQVLLVLGAAGGVGVSAVQIGKVCGAVVIAVARGIEKLQYLKLIGADHVIDLSKENVMESAKSFLKARGLKGVDVLYDPVGGKLMQDSLKLLNWGAHILLIGFASGDVPVIRANIALVKNWTIHGLYWGSYLVHQPAVLIDSLNELLGWLSKGLIKVQISHTYRLPEAHLAFAVLRDRKVVGKVMIVMGSSAKSRL